MFRLFLSPRTLLVYTKTWGGGGVLYLGSCAITLLTSENTSQMF